MWGNSDHFFKARKQIIVIVCVLAYVDDTIVTGDMGPAIVEIKLE